MVELMVILIIGFACIIANALLDSGMMPLEAGCLGLVIVLLILLGLYMAYRAFVKKASKGGG